MAIWGGRRDLGNRGSSLSRGCLQGAAAGQDVHPLSSFDLPMGLPYDRKAIGAYDRADIPRAFPQENLNHGGRWLSIRSGLARRGGPGDARGEKMGDFALFVDRMGEARLEEREGTRL